MQKNYLHGVPRRAGIKSRRVVLIFRIGNTKHISMDSGKKVEALGNKKTMYLPNPKRPTTNIGISQFKGVISEGKLYSRKYLWNTFSHRLVNVIIEFLS